MSYCVCFEQNLYHQVIGSCMYSPTTTYMIPDYIKMQPKLSKEASALKCVLL